MSVEPSHDGPCCTCRFCASMRYHCCALGIDDHIEPGELELFERTGRNRHLGNVEHRRASHMAASAARDAIGNQIILNYPDD